MDSTENNAAAIGAIGISGLALGFSFPPYLFASLAWVALTPILWRWENAKSWRRLLLEVYAAFLITFAVAFSWPLQHTFAKTALLSLSGLLLLPLLMSIPFAASLVVRRRAGLRPGLAALAAFYLAMEHAMSRGPLAFPWTLLGHTQAEALHFNQFLEITGVSGLSLWVILLNGLIYTLVRCSTIFQRAACVLALVLCIALPALYSQNRLQHPLHPHGNLLVGMAQPAIQAPMWARIHNDERVAQLLALSDSLLAVSPTRPDLIVWPETALPPDNQDTLFRKVQAWVTEHDLALLTGAITHSRSGMQQATYRNSALLFQPGAPLQQYDKTRLVPLAEYVPLMNRFPWLQALSIPSGGVAGYEPGETQRSLTIKKSSLGVLICFESVFGNYTRRYVEQQADFLVVLTQDGWWGQSQGYRQHVAFSRLRAIEMRRATVQVSVSGVTALIQPDGSIGSETGWMQRKATVVSVPFFRESTFYARHGDYPGWIAVAVSALFAGWMLSETISAYRSQTNR